MLLVGVGVELERRRADVAAVEAHGGAGRRRDDAQARLRAAERELHVAGAVDVGVRRQPARPLGDDVVRAGGDG